MGIDVHALNMLALQARQASLGRVLTIGRQSMSVPFEEARRRTGKDFARSNYCEPLLLALGAESVESIDYSAYEGATHVADMGGEVFLPVQYDTILDAGSLEHVFDVVAALRNVIGFCRVGGRIIHLLPVNNLSGHGFWQFSSDLMYSLYGERNGFTDTEVFYASSLDPEHWYLAPKSRAGVRVELVSIEPIILLCVTTKFAEVNAVNVVQPFYASKWEPEPRPSNEVRGPAGKGFSQVRKLLGPGLARVVRNAWRICELASGRGCYSLSGSHFRKLSVARLLEGGVR